jgi:hypothetical protein
MGGNQKFYYEPHGHYVVKKWQTYRDGDTEDGWNVDDVPQPGNKVKKGDNKKIHEWYEQVRSDEGWESAGVTKVIFVTNVKKLSLKYNTCGQQHSTDETESSEEIPREELAPEDTIEIEVEDEGGNTLALAYTQCVYQIAQEGGPEAKKIFINLQAHSGWYLSQEKDKRDFASLIDDGNTLCLSFTGNETFFNKNAACDVLGRSDVFGNIYAATNGVQHAATTAMASAIKALMPQGQVPSFIVTIPLIKKCRRISPVEGLIRRSRGGVAPVKDALPVVGFLVFIFI